MDDVLTLLAVTSAQNDYGVHEETVTGRQVFCQVESVTRSEFFGAGRNGLNPEFRFLVFTGDYVGEPMCEFHGLYYTIYRTYNVPGTDQTELYVERRGGTNAVNMNSGGTDEADTDGGDADGDSENDQTD